MSTYIVSREPHLSAYQLGGGWVFAVDGRTISRHTTERAAKRACDRAFARRAVSKRILEQRLAARGRRYIGRIIRRARRRIAKYCAKGVS